MKATKVEILRESVCKIVPMLSGKGITVTQMGLQAYVRYHPKTLKPQLVNIPYVPDNASDELLIAVQGFIDHEVAHVLFSEPKYIPMAQAAKVGGLYGIIEDTYIERRMKRTYSGSKSNLIQTWQFVQDRIVNPEIQKAVESGDSGALFSALLVPLMRTWSGQKELAPIVAPHLPTLDKYIKAIGLDLIEQVPAVSSSEEGFKLAVAMHNRLEELKRRTEREEPPPEKGDGEEGDSEVSGRGRADDDSVGSSGEADDYEESSSDSDGDDDSDAADSDEKFEDTEDDSDEDTAEDEEVENEEDGEDEESPDEESEEENPAEGSHEDSIEEPDEPGDGDDKGEANSEFDPKTLNDLNSVFESSKDMDSMMTKVISDEAHKAMRSCQYTPFTKDFDVIEEFKPRSSVAAQTTRLDELETKVAEHIAPLQRHLERCIAAKSHSRMIPGHRSGRINPSALHRIPTGDERLFRRKHISRTKDAAISLVVDLSGSMGGYKVDLAIQTAFAMSTSLDKLNITHEVIGFTTKDLPTRMPDGTRIGAILNEVVDVKMPSRIEPVYMPIFKPFNARFTNERRRALASYIEIALRNNTDGEAIEYAARRLAPRTESRKIMIVLSDGQPCAGAGSFDEQSWHLKHTVNRLEAAGIEMFGIGIMDNSVEHYYPKHVVLHDLEDLPKTVMQQLERMLLAAPKAA